MSAMKRIKRIQFGNLILREKARIVSLRRLQQPSLKDLIKRMFFTMRGLGVGLAAPQVGRPIQLVVVEIKKTKIRPHVRPLGPTVVVNPKITSVSKKIADDWEGCLSFPGVRGMVPRHESITVEYYDRMGAKKRIVLRGFQARVFQHEIDHLNGILYTDRMTDMKTLMTADEFKKRAVKKGGLKSR